MLKTQATENGLRHRGRDPRDQIEELEDANDKLSRAGISGFALRFSGVKFQT